MVSTSARTPKSLLRTGPGPSTALLAPSPSTRTNERPVGHGGGAPELSAEEARRIKSEDRAAGRCFVCRGEGHFARDCPIDPDRARAVRNGERRAVRRALFEQVQALCPDTDEEDEADREDASDLPVSDAVTRRVGRVQVQADELDAQEVDDEATIRRVNDDVPGTRFRSAPSCKLSVWVEGSSVRHDICPDSGADLFTISEKTLAAIAPHAERLPPAQVGIRGYAGAETQTPSAVVRLNLHFCTTAGTRLTKEAEFHVVRDCADGWLLGADNLAHFGFTVNLRDRCVQLAEDTSTRLPLREGKGVDPSARLLLVAQDITVPANSCILIPVHGPSQEATLDPYIFALDDQPDQITAAGRGLVGPQTRAVLMTNTASQSITFRANEALGELHAIDGVIGTADSPLEAMTMAAVHNTVSRLEIEQTRRLVVEWRVIQKLRHWAREQREETLGASIGAIRLGGEDRRVSFGDDPDQDEVLPEIVIPSPSSALQRITVTASLTRAQRLAVKEVLSAHAVWPTPSRPLGLYNGGEMTIRLKDEFKTWTHSEPPRRTSSEGRRAVDETLAEHDKLGISEPASGSFAFGVVLVKQKGKIRFCNDY
ncbi:hypothetical protein V8E36_006755, partial [Tilletia maclaganii]